MRGKILITGIFLFFLTQIVFAQGAMQRKDKTKLIAEIDSILQSQVDRDKIPGAVILIKKNGRVIYKHAYGFAQKYDYDHDLLNPPERMKANFNKAL